MRQRETAEVRFQVAEVHFGRGGDDVRSIAGGQQHRFSDIVVFAYKVYIRGKRSTNLRQVARNGRLAVGQQHRVVVPRHRLPLRPLGVTAYIHRHGKTLAVLHDMRIDTHAVAEEHVSQVQIKRQHRRESLFR